MTPTVFCLVPTRKLLSDNKKLGFDEQGRFQIRDSMQETMNFSGKDDPEFVRANIKNNLAVSRWYVIRTFSARFSPPPPTQVLVSSRFVQINTTCAIKNIFFIFLYS